MLKLRKLIKEHTWDREFGVGAKNDFIKSFKKSI